MPRAVLRLPRARPRASAPGAPLLRFAFTHSLAAVRATLAAPLAQETLRTCTLALRSDLAHAPAPTAAHAAALYANAATELAAAGRSADAAYVLGQLAALGCECDAALMLGVLGAARDPAAVWDAVVGVLGAPAPRECAHIVRTLLHRGCIGRAAKLVGAAVRSSWLRDTPPPSRALVHTLMIETKIVRRVLLEHTPGRLQPSAALFAEYADALVALGELLADNYMPIVADEKESLAWLIKHLYLFGDAAAEWRRAVPDAPVHAIAARVDHILEAVVARLPDGAPPPPLASRRSREDRQRFFCKPYGAQTYSALVHYTLSHANRPSWCRHVLEHMARKRTPPLSLSRTAVNTLVQQAARRRISELASSALEITSYDCPSHESSAQARLLARLDEAIHDCDTYRIAALLQYIARLRMRHRSEGSVRPSSALYRVYPELARFVSWRKSRTRPPPPPSAVYHPYVFTAALQVASAAGDLDLAVRLWGIIKLASYKSMVHRPWRVPVHAATLLFDFLARMAYRRPVRRRAASLAFAEYEWLLRHWAGTTEMLDARFFAALLRVLHTDPHSRARRLRVLRDMAALGIA